MDTTPASSAVDAPSDPNSTAPTTNVTSVGQKEQQDATTAVLSGGITGGGSSSAQGMESAVSMRIGVELGERTGGGAKRGRDTVRDDDLMSLVNLLGNVTTDDHDALVDRIVEVLQVDGAEARFYLEASRSVPIDCYAEAAELLCYRWNVQEALGLLLDTQGAEGRGKRRVHRGPLYRARQVCIEDLPEGVEGRCLTVMSAFV